MQFKLLTGKDDAEVLKIMEGKKKLGSQIESGVTTRLLQSIVSVGGDTDKNKISQFVNSMPAQDSRALRKYIEEIEPGVDMKQQATCSHCGYQTEVDMPLGMSFFWPDV